MDRDCRGRLRRPEQARGLQPMHPLLPDRWESRALRVAMSEDDWARLEALVRRVADGEETRARALGAALSYLLRHEAAVAPQPGPLDWLDWERRKAYRALRLLQPGA
ncbi:hypothetical protein [Tautonia sociabilis]|uniref:Uncharacterized protein n=1 Tax=Tautonia sociabilis TaxID=2080755 RepID=A0A432MFM9_9BACT|nr:hypothetical protein [Tautonia sociabilis]RUL85009.1 hypothetical protein TsocGM_19395 [Tautonia sociabilis]